MPEPKPPWPHAPTHQLSEAGTYIVTAGTYLKAHHFRGARRLRVLHRGLLTVARDFGWRLEAWAVFSNHYHFIAHSPELGNGAESLRDMLGLLHEKTAKWINRMDGTPGCAAWHNFWDTRLTYERSYRARLNYVHQNPVKHGLVPVASQYPWCSAAWFERTASPAQVRTIYGFKMDSVNVYDEFDVQGDWWRLQSKAPSPLRSAGALHMGSGSRPSEAPASDFHSRHPGDGQIQSAVAASLCRRTP